MPDMIQPIDIVLTYTQSSEIVERASVGVHPVLNELLGNTKTIQVWSTFNY